MPSLGFLKKKRTKDSSNDNQPTSPTKDIFASSPTVASPIKPTFSDQQQPQSLQNSSQLAPDSAPHPQSPDQQLDPSSTQPPTSSSAPSMNTPGHSSPGPQHPQTNAPTIQSLLNQTPSHPQRDDTPRETKGKYALADFQMQRTLGTGSFGRVHLVQSRHNQRFYAIKVLKKAQVVKMKQVEHTNDERKMLQRVKHPFLITLWGTFQDSKNLYMVMDFIEGGELFSLLRKSQVSIVYCIISSLLTVCLAVSQPSRQILRRRGRSSPGLSAFNEHYLP
jgi:protein kinase A